jgi:hypothetical protein
VSIGWFLFFRTFDQSRPLSGKRLKPGWQRKIPCDQTNEKYLLAGTGLIWAVFAHRATIPAVIRLQFIA